MRGLPRILMTLTLVGGWLAVSLCAATASAADLDRFGRYHGWAVESFAAQGAPESLADGLNGGLALAGTWRITGTRRPPFSVDLLADDIKRIVVYLAQHGYPAATVTPQITATEQDRELEVVLAIDPGPPVLIGRVTAVGWPERVVWPDSTDRQVFQPDMVFDDARVAASASYLRLRLLDAGYALAEVTAEIEAAGSAAAPRIEVVYRVVPGEFYRISVVTVSGCSDDLVATALRVIDIAPDTEFSDQLIRRAERDLRATQLFNTVRLQPQPAGPGQLRLDVVLGNARLRSWNASIGTWTDNPWAVRAGWIHRNLLSHGIGGDITASYAAHERSAGAGLFWLGWLNPRARTRLSIDYAEELEDAYDSREKTLQLVQSFRPRPRDILNVGISLSDIDVDQHGAQTRELSTAQGRLLELWCDVKWDRTDDPLFPRNGGYLKLSGTLSPPGFLSESPYVTLQADVGRYVPLAGAVLAGRGRLGWGKALGDARELLLNRRFYAGGYNTMRGYRRRRLGPRDLDDNPQGGSFVVLAGAELRFPLIWIIDGALFCDSGQVWSDPDEADLGDLAVAVGADLDLRTPLGPVRVGYAHNVAGLMPGEPEDLFHFGIGYPW